MSTREKLADFLADYEKVNGPRRDRVTYTVRDSNGDGTVERYQDDLGRDPNTHVPLVNISGEDEGGPSLVNDFLEYLTTAENYYALKGNATKAQPLSRLDESGQAVVLKDAENTGAKNVFAGATSLGDTLSSYSNSGQFFESNSGITLGKIVSKYGDITADSEGASSTDGARSGNTLLSSIEGQSLDTTGKTFVQTTENDSNKNAIKGVEEVLLKKNRFNTDLEKAYFPYDSDSLADDLKTGAKGVGTETVQTAYGSYDKNGDILKTKDLKELGASLMLKALGIDPNATNPDSFDYDGDSVWAISAAPELAGKNKARADNLPRNAFGSPTVEGTGESPYADSGAFNLSNPSSYGSDFTPDFYYSKDSTLEPIRIRAAAAILGMLFWSQSLESILSDSWDGEGVDLGRGPYNLGQAKRLAAKSKFQLFTRMIIPYTRFSFSESIKMGAKVLFGTTFSEASVTGDKAAIVASFQTVEEAPLFWYAIAKSFLKKYQQVAILGSTENFVSNPSSAISSILSSIADSGMMGILRVLSQVGDIALYATGGNSDMSDAMTDSVRPFDIDSLPDTPATRISKSRSKNGQTSAALAWRGNAVPGMHLLPRNVVKATMDMDNLAVGANPVKGHTTNDLIMKTYININGAGQSSRIPTDVLRRMENALDAEYVPFYFHDVRTNEITGFHAFLTNLSDNITPNFSTEGGYGRIDKVKIYKDTSRSLSVGFYVAATSKEDFDEMWFKINKLTNLVYPKWTKGTVMKDTNGNSFIQPFSQTIGATPLVRMRIGDVVKSNYSRFNLARLFGVGEREFDIDKSTFKAFGGASGLINRTLPKIGEMSISDLQMDTVFKIMFGSPLAFGFFSGDAGASQLDTIANSLISTSLTLNGFVNPVGAGMVIRQLRNPSEYADVGSVPETGNSVLNAMTSLGGIISEGISGMQSDEIPGFKKGGGLLADRPILKPSMDIGYRMGTTDLTEGVPRGARRFRTTVPYVVNIVNKKWVSVNKYQNANSAHTSKGFDNPGRVKRRVQYEVEVEAFDGPASLKGQTLLCFHEDLLPNPEIMFMKNVSPFLDIVGTFAGAAELAINNYAAKTTGIPANALKLTTTDAAEFMHPTNNSITRAFENSGGRGLAGVIKNLSFEWADGSQVWETEWGSRAPKFCKVTLGFDVIHDIPPGLDSSGYSRAPIYNVGATMNSIAGDVQPDGGLASKQSYKRAGVAGTQALSKKVQE